MKALIDEEQFFLDSPYKHMKMGAKYLQQVLNIELGSHIKTKIPEIRSKLLKNAKRLKMILTILDMRNKLQQISVGI